MAEKNIILRAENVTKKFGGVVALNGCTVYLEEGRIYGLIGPNGSGKSTFFNVISGIYRPDGGSVYFRGEDITGLKPHEVARRGIGRVFQITRVFQGMTVLENLLVAARVKTSEEKAIGILKFFNLDHLKNEYARNLSYGEQKLLEFARILMLDPDLILLDEPAAGLTPLIQDKMKDYIRKLNKGGKTFFIVEHNMRFVMDLCEYIFVLHHGCRISEGKPEVVRDDKKVIEAYLG